MTYWYNNFFAHGHTRTHYTLLYFNIAFLFCQGSSEKQDVQKDEYFLAKLPIIIYFTDFECKQIITGFIFLPFYGRISNRKLALR